MNHFMQKKSWLLIKNLKNNPAYSFRKENLSNDTTVAPR